ncbi:HET-domain-containing protein [Hyaloscypha variabilis F]|uniref:HET-domain-containing protein n=1 Tax=Hyaloscypha variabilis (strain UAMH 11265 / GT02V1 / F) TaxID=1149755 RepID=A0A2J6RX92_HYAVF|nr:HET-domain-containing protein [Hyaloscypha variabilis F]
MLSLLTALTPRSRDRAEAERRASPTSLSRLCKECKRLLGKDLSNEALYSEFKIKFKIYLRGHHRKCDLCTLILQQLSPEAAGYLRERSPEQLDLVASGQQPLSSVNGPLTMSLVCDRGSEENWRVPEIVESLTLNPIQLLWVPQSLGKTDSAIHHRVESLTNSDSNWELSRTWYDRCCRSHKCGSLDSARRNLPTRLIRIDKNPLDGTPRLRLCLTDSLPSSTPYCTLSHCWGKSMIVRLIRLNLDPLQEIIYPEALSKTFRNAIQAATNFGFDYIWIDSLCIIQDDVEDWKREAATMCDVYSGSALNFAATAARDGSYGCFFNRDPRHVRTCRIQVTQIYPDRKMKRVFECMADSHWKVGVEESPLVSRGWVMQERMLAPRTLHFGATQFFWECAEIRACESFPNGLPSIKSKWADPHDESYLLKKIDNPGRLWRSAIAVYSAADLTKAEDKLIALSGVCRMLHNRTGDTYVAGLWRQNLELNLLWETRNGIHGKHKVSGLLRRNISSRPQNYRAPSWSWASHDSPVEWRGPVNWERLLQARVRIMISVLDIESVLSSPDPFGQIKSCTLRIKCGPLLPCRVTVKWTTDPNVNIGHYSVGTTKLTTATCDLDEETPAEGSVIFALVVCSYGAKCEGLLLEGTWPRGHYRRLGHWVHENQREATIDMNEDDFDSVFRETAYRELLLKSMEHHYVRENPAPEYEAFLGHDKDGLAQYVISLV